MSSPAPPTYGQLLESRAFPTYDLGARQGQPFAGMQQTPLFNGGGPQPVVQPAAASAGQQGPPQSGQMVGGAPPGAQGQQPVPTTVSGAFSFSTSTWVIIGLVVAALIIIIAALSYFFKPKKRPPEDEETGNARGPGPPRGLAYPSFGAGYASRGPDGAPIYPSDPRRSGRREYAPPQGQEVQTDPDFMRSGEDYRGPPTRPLRPEVEHPAPENGRGEALLGVPKTILPSKNKEESAEAPARKSDAGRLSSRQSFRRQLADDGGSSVEDYIDRVSGRDLGERLQTGGGAPHQAQRMETPPSTIASKQTGPPPSPRTPPTHVSQSDRELLEALGSRE